MQYNTSCQLGLFLDLRVFGLRAGGDAELDSDLDVFIEVEACTPELRQRISEIAWEVGFEMGRVISTVVASPGSNWNRERWGPTRLS